MLSSRRAVASWLEPAPAMSPAPTKTGSPGGGGGGGVLVVTTSCGAFAPASRASYITLSVLVEVAPKENVPLPVTVDVTSISYQVLRDTAPSVPTTAPSIAGWLFQVTAVSNHVVLVIVWNVPPFELPALFTLATCTRSFTLVTGSTRPLTVNLRNVLSTGELFTMS